MVVAALIISIVALVLAVIALLPIMLGKPKLTLEFSVNEIEGGRILSCDAFNLPIRSRLLNQFGIKRLPAEDVVVRYSIEEYESQRVIHTGIVPNIKTWNGRADAIRATIPSSFIPSQFEVAFVKYDDRKTREFSTKTILPIGKYVVKVTVLAQEKHIEREKLFIVKSQHPFASWG